MKLFGVFKINVTEYISFQATNTSFNTGNICSKIRQIVTKFYQIFEHLNLVNLEPLEWPLNSVFTKNMVKYGADREITNIYENLQTV